MLAAPTEHLPGGVLMRPAIRADLDTVIELIRALADYERLSHAVVLDRTLMAQQLFEQGAAEIVLLEQDGRNHGFALYFHNFSTFEGRRGLYLEDLYVRPEARALGHGRALMSYLARLAVRRNCARFEWSVLDWNQPALDFYRKLGATGQDEWTVQRLEGAALKALAAGSLAG